MLEKPLTDFICNESRRSVINKYWAKFRCNGLNVVLIYDLILQKTVSFIGHETYRWGIPIIVTRYKVGEVVKPDQFDYNLDKVCTHGIHYFLTIEAAMSYDIQQGYCIIGGESFGIHGNLNE
jgi:hypothetical protein